MSSSFSTVGAHFYRRWWQRWQRQSSGVRRRQAVQLAVIAFLTLWLATGGWQRSIQWLDVGDDDTAAASTAETPAIDATGQQSIVLRENGNKVLEFEAERIVVSADHVFASTEKVRRGTLYREGRPYLQLKAEKVRLNQQTRDWEANGQLWASGPNGFTVQTRHAFWNERQNQLRCPGEVKGTVRGLGFETRQILYDVGRSEMKCPETVRITAKNGTFQGRNAVIDTKSRRIEFTGDGEIVMRPAVRTKISPLPASP